MTARRIGVTPGSGDFVGAIDTELQDESTPTNDVSAQLFALVSERGEVAGDITSQLEAIREALGVTNKLLLMMLNRPVRAKGK